MKRWMTIVLVAAGAAAVGWWMLRPQAIPVGLAPVEVMTVREFITEEGTTRLPTTWPIDMPLTGTLLRLPVEIGDAVAKGQEIGRVDAFDLQQQIAGVAALIAQVRAQMEGVDTAKPKDEQIAAARLRVDTARDGKAMAQRQLDAVQVNFDNARRDYERLRSINEQGGVSRSQFDEAERLYRTLEQEVARLRIGLESAAKSVETAELELKALIDSVDDNEYMRTAYRAEIDNLQARLDALNNDLAKTVIGSPIDGVVLDRRFEGGIVLAPGTPIMTLGNFAEVEIEADVLSEEIPRIAPGQGVEITGKAVRDGVVAGSVKRIYPAGFKKISALGIEQQRVRVIIGFDNSKVQLRPGTRIDVSIIVAERADTRAVPERAVFRKEEQWMVFVERNGRAELTPVSIGLRNDQWAEILQGLEPGDVVVTEPTNNIQPGVRVRPA